MRVDLTKLPNRLDRKIAFKTISLKIRFGLKSSGISKFDSDSEYLGPRVTNRRSVIGNTACSAARAFLYMAHATSVVSTACNTIVRWKFYAELYASMPHSMWPGRSHHWGWVKTAHRVWPVAPHFVAVKPLLFSQNSTRIWYICRERPSLLNLYYWLSVECPRPLRLVNGQILGIAVSLIAT